MDNTSYTPDSTLLAQNLALEKELALQLRVIDKLEQDLEDAIRNQEAANAAVSKAQFDARTCKEQLTKAEQRQDCDMRLLMADLDRAVTAGEEMKRKFHVLADGRDAAKNQIADLKLQSQQDSEQYEANKRSLERKAHVAEARLQALIQEVEMADAQQAYEADGPRTTSEQYQSQEVGDSPRSSMFGTVESPRGFTAMPNTTTLADEFDSDFWDSDEEQVEMDLSCGGSDTDTDMETWKAQIQTSRYSNKGVQVDCDDQPEEQESRVDSVGLDIMERLDVLALRCGDLGWKSVKIYRSADWMVVLFP